MYERRDQVHRLCIWISLLLVALQRDLHPPLLLVNQWVLARDLNIDLELRLPLSLLVDMQWDPRDLGPQLGLRLE